MDLDICRPVLRLGVVTALRMIAGVFACCGVIDCVFETAAGAATEKTQKIGEKKK